MKLRTLVPTFLPLLLLLVPLVSSQTTECRPGDNCLPPDCRCWNDETIPGGLDSASTPQIVVVTFQNAINSANVDTYTQLFQGINNPNDCPAVGTFFVQETNTDMSVVNTLALQGHEIGVTSVDGTPPQTEEDWISNITQVRNDVINAGVPEARVLGVRAPQLQPGGLEEFTALAGANMLYDASCTTSRFDVESNLRWPYTFDFVPGPDCDSGSGPEVEFPGKWEVMIADLEFDGVKCATPAACTNVVSQDDAFRLFQESFAKHYEGGRSPFVVVMNPEWVVDSAKNEGTVEFLRYVRDAFPDTWMLTATQALEWVRNPVDNDNAISDYPPWACLNRRGAPAAAGAH